MHWWEWPLGTYSNVLDTQGKKEDRVDVSLALEFSAPEEFYDTCLDLQGGPRLEMGSREQYLIKQMWIRLWKLFWLPLIILQVLETLT